MWEIYADTKEHIKSIYDIIDSSPSNFIFKTFYYFLTIDSTQKFAIDLIKKNRIKNSDPVIVISDSQSLGKGRKGEIWSSPKGGIWLSIVLSRYLKIQELFECQMIASISICETIEIQTGLKPVLKWPNDIFIEGKKICGIIIDSEIESNKIESIVLGIGINTNNDYKETIYEINSRKLFHYPVTTIKDQLNCTINNSKFISELLNKINIYLYDLNNSYFFRQKLFQLYSMRIIESMDMFNYYFKNGDNRFRGLITRVESDGSLLVKKIDGNIDSHAIARINSAYDVDIEILRKK